MKHTLEEDAVLVPIRFCQHGTQLISTWHTDIKVEDDDVEDEEVGTRRMEKDDNNEDERGDKEKCTMQNTVRNMSKFKYYKASLDTYIHTYMCAGIVSLC